MKRIIKYSLIVTVVHLTIISCSDNFLQPEPQSFFTPEKSIVDKNAFEALLVTMKKNFVADYTGNGNLMTDQWNTSEAAAGKVYLDLSRMSPGGGTHRLNSFVGQINNLYEYIKDANTVISRIDDIEWEDQQDRDEILAKALWHRSYWYYRLVHNYGDVPFIGEEVKGVRLDFQTHSRWAVLDKIQEDMEYAVEHLPESVIPGTITRGAGNHLLAKIYLANLEFEKARDAATEVINGPYALMTERFGEDADDPKRNVIWDLHRPNNKSLSGNTETILSFIDRFEVPEGARSDGLFTMRTYHPDWWHSRNRDSEGNRGMIDSGAMYDSLGRGNPNAPLTEWYQYEIWEEFGHDWQDTPDLRRADINWVDVHEMRYNNPESVNFGQQWRFEWYTGNEYLALASMYAFPYHKTFVPMDNPIARPVGGNGDWYIFRLAEIYLIRAEANYWLNNLQAAADDINVVRERSEAIPITAGDVTIDYIFDERARELFAETPRKNELVRVSFIMAELGMNGYSPETLHESNWYYDRVTSLNFFYPQYRDKSNRTHTFLGLPVTNISDNFTFFGQFPRIQPHNYLWPIDEIIITSNTLGRINQNLGYAGAENNEPPIETVE